MPDDRTTGMRESLNSLAEKMQAIRSARRGDIVFVVSGAEAGNYTIRSGPGEAGVLDGTRPERAPLIEVLGDTETIRAILDGERDAREQFLKGGIRVRGDLRYLSDVAMELGILKAPL